MSLPLWKSKFQQPISGYNPVEAQGLSELGYALQHGQIPEEDYLTWARESFELCSVDVKFFQTHPAPRKIFEKVKDAYSWGPECLPIAEWEGCLLIAGIEKPADIPPELTPVFFLAPIKSLIEYWSVFSSEEPVEISEEGAGSEEASGMPDGINLDLATSSGNLGLSFTGISLAQADHAPAEATKKESAPLSSQDLYSTRPIKAPGAPVPNITAPQPLEAAVASIDQTQPGIQVKPGIPSAPAAAAPAAKKEIPVTLQPVPQILKTEEPTERIKVVVSEERMERTPPLSPKSPPPQAEDTALITPKPDLEATVPEIKAQPQPAPTIPESAVQKTFVQCKKHYEKLVYIEMRATTRNAQVLFWPPDFVAKEQPSAFSMEEDSFLSIVFKTQKAYHGYLIKSAPVERFFREVNSGEIPENVTVVPVMQNDILVGAIMGWGPKTTYTLTVLRDMEKAVSQMCLELGWVKTEAA